MSTRYPALPCSKSSIHKELGSGSELDPTHRRPLSLAHSITHLVRMQPTAPSPPTQRELFSSVPPPRLPQCLALHSAVNPIETINSAGSRADGSFHSRCIGKRLRAGALFVRQAALGSSGTIVCVCPLWAQPPPKGARGVRVRTGGTPLCEARQLLPHPGPRPGPANLSEGLQGVLGLLPLQHLLLQPGRGETAVSRSRRPAETPAVPSPARDAQGPPSRSGPALPSTLTSLSAA